MERENNLPDVKHRASGGDYGQLASYLKRRVIKELEVSPKQIEEELGPLDALVDRIIYKQAEVQATVRNSQGKFRVLGVDQFNGSDWVDGEFDTEEEAIAFAKQRTAEESKYASSPSIATVFYAYNPQGRYLSAAEKPSGKNR